MSEMKPRQWFQARLRWAVLEEGHGLYRWREAEHIFLVRTARHLSRGAPDRLCRRVLAQPCTRSEGCSDD